MTNVNKKNVEKKYKRNRIKRANKIKRANRIKATKIVPISNIDLEKGVIEQNVNDDDNSSNLCCKCEFNKNYVLIIIFILIIFIILFSFIGSTLTCLTNCSLTN